MSRRVVVTGGFGYVGGRIAQELSRAGWTVRLTGRSRSGAPDWLPEAEVASTGNFDPSKLAAAFRETEAVVHMAAMNENECVTDPSAALVANTLGTLKTLEAAVSAGVKTFLYFSTAHVYASPLVGHFTEATLPRPIHPYAITHRAAEDFVLAARDRKLINGIVVRLSNGFGAPTHPDVDRWTLLVNDLCRQAARTRRIVLRSSGIQQRDFITLEDVGRAVVHLLALKSTGDGLFNLGDKSKTVRQMTDLIAERCRAVLGFTPAIERPEPSPEESAETLHFDSAKLRATGFAITGDPVAEIDATLALCAAASATPA